MHLRHTVGAIVAVCAISVLRCAEFPEDMVPQLNPGDYLSGGQPAIGIGTSSLTPSCVEGANASASVFEVWNDGTGALSFAVGDDVAWLTCTPSSAASLIAQQRQVVAVQYSTSMLAVGTHTATITVTGQGTTRTIGVTLTVTGAPQPAIAVSQSALAPACVQGESAASQTLDVWNAGTGTLDFSVSDDAPWLSCSPVSGNSTGASDKRSVTVQYNTSTMAAGNYLASIRVSGAGEAVINVSLTVTSAPQPAIGLSDTAISVSCVQGQNAGTRLLEVWNSGTGTLNYSASSGSSWLSVNPSSGTSANEGERCSVTVLLSTSSLAVGNHSGAITFSGAGTRVVIVDLTVTAAPQPSIGLSDTMLTRSCVQGQNATAGSFEVWNAGTGTLAFAVSDTCGWLEVTPPSGQSTGSSDRKGLTITYATGSLAVGTYSTTLTVGGAGTRAVRVVLTVSAAPQPQVGLSATAISMSCTTGTNPSSKAFQVWNSATGTLNFSIADDQNWLSCSPTSGSSASSTDTRSIAVQASVTSFATGTYTANITVGGGSGVTSRTIVVTLTVYQSVAPVIATSTGPLSVSTTMGTNATAQSIQVWNSGTGTLSFTVSKNQTWLTLATTSGSSTGPSQKVTIPVEFNTSALSVGNYTGTVTVSATGLISRTVTVNLAITSVSLPPCVAAGRRFALSAGYVDRDADNPADLHHLAWLGGNPWSNDAKTVNRWGDVVLDTTFGGSGSVPTANNSDASLIAYKLTAVQESGFSRTDGSLSAFWGSWGGRDSILLVPPAGCYVGRCGFTGGSADAQLVVKAAAGTAGLYLCFIADDDEFVDRGGTGDWSADAIELFVDQISADSIFGCVGCLIGLYASTLTYTSTNVITWLGRTAPPADVLYKCYDENLWSWQEAVLTYANLQTLLGWHLEPVSISGSRKAVEVLIPWAKLGCL